MLYLFFEKNNNSLQWVLPGGTLFDAQTLFIFYGNICILFSNISRKITVLLKMYSSCIYNAFTVLFIKYCFLTNNLLIPDMSCITYWLMSGFPKCFYQCLLSISIGCGFTSCHILLVSLFSILLDYYINVKNTFLIYFVNSIYLIFTNLDFFKLFFFKYSFSRLLNLSFCHCVTFWI